MEIEQKQLGSFVFGSIPITVRSNIHFVLSLYAEAIKS